MRALLDGARGCPSGARAHHFVDEGAAAPCSPQRQLSLNFALRARAENGILSGSQATSPERKSRCSLRQGLTQNHARGTESGLLKVQELKERSRARLPTARVKIKTPVTHRTRSRLAAAMRATAATTDAHGHSIGTFEWRGPSRTVRVRLLGRLKRVKRAGVSRSKINVRYCPY